MSFTCTYSQDVINSRMRYAACRCVPFYDLQVFQIVTQMNPSFSLRYANKNFHEMVTFYFVCMTTVYNSCEASM